MPYRIELKPSVEREVSKFQPETRRYFDACLERIAEDPRERHGLFVDPAIPERGTPARTFVFEIREEASFSGEKFYAFYGEFLAEYAILYTLQEEAPVVEVFYLRQLI